jgi:hypothetical protein
MQRGTGRFHEGTVSGIHMCGRHPPADVTPTPH